MAFTPFGWTGTQLLKKYKSCCTDVVIKKTYTKRISAAVWNVCNRHFYCYLRSGPIHNGHHHWHYHKFITRREKKRLFRIPCFRNYSRPGAVRRHRHRNRAASLKTLTCGLSLNHLWPSASLPATSGTTSPSHTVVVHPSRAKASCKTLRHQKDQEECEKATTTETVSCWHERRKGLITQRR